MRYLLTIITLLIQATFIPSNRTTLNDQTLIPQSKAKDFESIPLPKGLLLPPDTIKLAFMGDVMMHKRQILNSFNIETGEYTFDGWLSGIQCLVDESDLAIANMEFTLGGKPYTGYPCFSAPDSFIDYLKGCGIDVFLTANNHILDKGKSGFERTLTKYSENKIFFTGASLSEDADSLFNPLIVPIRGVRIAFLNFTYGTNFPDVKRTSIVHRLDSADVTTCLKRAKSRGADVVIVLPHWGVEYSLKHAKTQRQWAEIMAENGADAVIGAHPHVVQDTEMVNGVPVVYSMGNLISNMTAANTRVGLIVTLRIAVSIDRKCTILEPEYAFTWCAQPGALDGTFRTIIIKEWLDKEDEWLNKADFRNMTASYKRVKDATGIID